MTDAERTICKMYLEDLDKNHSCNEYHLLMDMVDHSVNSHWIWDSKSNVYRCSCCNQFPWRINTEENDEVFIDMKRTNAYKFCPNCGHRMIEPQESEDKG